MICETFSFITGFTNPEDLKLKIRAPKKFDQFDWLRNGGLRNLMNFLLKRSVSGLYAKKNKTACCQFLSTFDSWLRALPLINYQPRETSRNLNILLLLLLLLLLFKIRIAIEAGFIIGSGQQQVA